MVRVELVNFSNTSYAFIISPIISFNFSRILDATTKKFHNQESLIIFRINKERKKNVTAGYKGIAVMQN